VHLPRKVVVHSHSSPHSSGLPPPFSFHPFGHFLFTPEDRRVSLPANRVNFQSFLFPPLSSRQAELGFSSRSSPSRKKTQLFLFLKTFLPWSFPRPFSSLRYNLKPPPGQFCKTRTDKKLFHPLLAFHMKGWRKFPPSSTSLHQRPPLFFVNTIMFSPLVR